MTHCPRCNAKLGRTTKEDLVKGYTVIRCRTCKRKSVLIEGIAPEWVDDGPDQVKKLERKAFEMMNFKRFMDSDGTGPEWEKMG